MYRVFKPLLLCLAVMLSGNAYGQTEPNYFPCPPEESDLCDNLTWEGSDVQQVGVMKCGIIDVTAECPGLEAALDSLEDRIDDLRNAMYAIKSLYCNAQSPIPGPGHAGGQGEFMLAWETYCDLCPEGKEHFADAMAILAADDMIVRGDLEDLFDHYNSEIGWINVQWGRICDLLDDHQTTPNPDLCSDIYDEILVIDSIVDMLEDSSGAHQSDYSDVEDAINALIQDSQNLRQSMIAWAEDNCPAGDPGPFPIPMSVLEGGPRDEVLITANAAEDLPMFDGSFEPVNAQMLATKVVSGALSSGECGCGSKKPVAASPLSGPLTVLTAAMKPAVVSLASMPASIP